MSKYSVLVVERDPSSQDVLRHFLEQQGYSVWLAFDIQDAIQQLSGVAMSVDALIIDALTTDADRQRLGRYLRSLGNCCGHLPIIMQVAVDDETDFAHTLNQGVAYFLARPFVPEKLLAVLGAAIKDRQMAKDLLHSMRLAKQVFGLLDAAELSFRTFEEAHALAAMLAHVCPEPERILPGLAHLMVNAIEHGNLGLNFEEKSHLLASDTYYQEIQRRLRHPTYLAKQAQIRFVRYEEGIHFHIIDQGDGFAWQRFFQFSRDRAFHLNGRGIAMARLLSFDRVQYLGNGSQVMCSLIGDKQGGERSHAVLHDFFA